MIQRTIIACCGLVLCTLAVERDASGQMFGERSLGRPLNIQEGQSQFEDTGTLTGNERFLRRNRPPTAFVGPDLRSLRDFVGVIQARPQAQVRPSTEGLRRRVDRSADVNQPVTPAPEGRPYNPRLSIPYAPPTIKETALADNLLDLLADSPEISGASRIAVSVEGRTAILRGEVRDAADRDLVQMVISFEPGISSIQNDLTVNPQLRQSSDSLAARRRQMTREPTWITMSHSPSGTADSFEEVTDAQDQSTDSENP